MTINKAVIALECLIVKATVGKIFYSEVDISAMVNKEVKFIPALIIEYFQQNGIDFIKALPDNYNLTIEDIIEFCEKEAKHIGKYDINFEKLIREAVASGYDKRYLVNSSSHDRNECKQEFCESFFSILKQLCIFDFYQRQNVVVVGVGNGSEGEMIYNNIDNISIVDIAPKSLDKAKEILPHAKTFQNFSDRLVSFTDSSFDLYVSLRTYQSTYFNILASLKEAKRILKKNGSIIISIACGYLNSENNFVYGLYNPHNGQLEKERPDLYVNTILKRLQQLGFTVVGTSKIPSEIFIFAKNTN